MSELPDKLTVLTIENRHGTDSWICEDMDVAYEILDKYVKDWWAEESDDGEDIPEDRDERIERYFEEIVADEYYSFSISKIYTKDNLNDD